MSDEKAVILCGPVSWNYPPVIASKKLKALCGHEVWVGPASEKLVEDDKANLLCVPCGMNDPEMQKEIKANGIALPATIRTEIEGVFGVEETKRAMTRFNIQEREI